MRSGTIRKPGAPTTPTDCVQSRHVSFSLDPETMQVCVCVCVGVRLSLCNSEMIFILDESGSGWIEVLEILGFGKGLDSGSQIRQEF